MVKSFGLNIAVVLGLLVLGEISGPSTQTGLQLVFVVAMLALSWDVLSRIGLVSIGQGAFFGFAVYGAAILLGRGFGFITAFIATGVAILALCLILGIITLRLRGVYFSLATLALGLTGQAAILIAPQVTGGAGGLPSPLLGNGDLGVQILLLALGLLACVVVSELLLHSRWGTIFFVVRDAAPVAQASGLSITVWRIVAFAIAGEMAALAGVLYGGLFGYINADDVLSPNWSVLAIAAAVIGGTDSTIGSLVGGVLIVVANQYLSTMVHAGIDQIAYGVLLIAVILTLRGGVIAPLTVLWNRVGMWISRRGKAQATHVRVAGRMGVPE